MQKGSKSNKGIVHGRLIMVWLVGATVSVAALSALGFGCLRALSVMASDSPRTAAQSLTAYAGAVALVALGWLAGTVAIDVIGALTPGRVGAAAARVSDIVTPIAIRRVTTALLGATLTGVSAGAAHAAPLNSASVQLPRANGATWVSATAGVPDPTFTVTRKRAGAAPNGAVVDSGAAAETPRNDRTSPPDRTSSTVRVRPGDTLWGLAADQLGPHPSAAAVARSWPAWFEANRDIIDDPDVIFPGQVLRRPAGEGR